MAILPALVPQNGDTTLLSSDALLLLERRTEGARSDLGVLVVPAKQRSRQLEDSEQQKRMSFRAAQRWQGHRTRT